MTPIIEVHNLGKRYNIGEYQAPYATLRESLASAVRSPLKRLRGNGHSAQNTIWALKDVSFDVKPGEVVGIIGRNGAGKSTLLKVLSRITEPTSGGIDLYGRVASLLEVGTGFHSELSGRENIYLNGAILGMSRAEIKLKFDDIVAFAEVEKFLDTPVKHYSSGMYMRLAFAVAAHMESEILLVDEVLAVGDADFQKRCLGKMEEVGLQGRTVLFVSHSMPMILRLCRRVILLGNGKILADGTPHEVTREYLHSDAGSPGARVWPNRDEAPGDNVARLHAVRVLDDQGEVSEIVDIRKPVSIEVEYWNLQESLKPTISMHFINEDGVTLFCTNDWTNLQWWNKNRTPGLVRATCKVPGNFLAEGRVFLLVAVCTYNPDVVHVLERDAASFQVVDRSEGDGVRGVHSKRWPGILRPMLEWDVFSDPTSQSSERGA
jgi:lipopolysaccharide transport system ATP-binding protein